MINIVCTTCSAHQQGASQTNALACRYAGRDDRPEPMQRPATLHKDIYRDVGSCGMSFVQDYMEDGPTRQDLDSLAGATLLEFGNSWCGFCRRAEPLIREAFANHSSVRHIRIADASGQRLGRSFRVKQWPTLVFLKDGKEMSRLIRPTDPAAIRKAFGEIATTHPTS